MKRLLIVLAVSFMAAGADLRIGIIGTDTSHATAFAKALQNEAGVRIVAAYKGGSADVEASRTRVDKFAEELRGVYKVEIVPDIPSLLSKVDAVLLLSVDGRTHLDQVRQVIKVRKPVFIDKPLAATLEHAREIARIAKEAGVPWFSSSSLRFGPFAESMKFPDVRGALVWGPGPTEPHHALELSWYGIHAIELLYSILGPGCETVSMISGGDGDTITGRWKDGRLGTARLIRPTSDYGATVFRSKGSVQSDPAVAKVDYRPMLDAIIAFFKTGKSPVSEAETLEIFAFMDAAQRSKAAHGASQSLR